MEAKLVKVSKFLSLVLRHRPEVIGVELAPDGWVEIAVLLEAAKRHGKQIDQETLLRAVRENDKQRFAISPDGLRIRANQGHSTQVDLGLAPTPPPNVLFHGTVAKFLESIRQQGLISGSRQHVHLSAERQTAETVGRRRGSPTILIVDAGKMAGDEHDFFLSENGVWLTLHVPPKYITFPD